MEKGDQARAALRERKESDGIRSVARVSEFLYYTDSVCIRVRILTVSDIVDSHCKWLN